MPVAFSTCGVGGKQKFAYGGPDILAGSSGVAGGRPACSPIVAARIGLVRHSGADHLWCAPGAQRLRVAPHCLPPPHSSCQETGTCMLRSAAGCVMFIRHM